MEQAVLEAEEPSPALGRLRIVFTALMAVALLPCIALAWLVLITGFRDSSGTFYVTPEVIFRVWSIALSPFCICSAVVRGLSARSGLLMRIAVLPAGVGVFHAYVSWPLSTPDDWTEAALILFPLFFLATAFVAFEWIALRRSKRRRVPT